MTSLQCPFCGWHRRPDMSKANPIPWNADAMMLELLAHLDAIHYDTFYGFLNTAIAWRQRQMVEGQFPRIVNSIIEGTAERVGE